MSGIVKSDAAKFAKTMTGPIKLPLPAPVETRSKLFDPVIIELPKRKKPSKVRQVEKGAMNIEMPPVRHGEMNRPDKSEMRNNLTFNWG